MSFLRFTLFVLFLSAVMVSCQKDQNVDIATLNAVKADSLITKGLMNAPGNYLATQGTLKVTVDDSTYIFDAATDSIAFVNVAVDTNKYFGITAINKAHTMSFGISSAGAAGNNINTSVAGSQLLFSADDKPGLQYTLTKYAHTKDIGKISLEQYLQDSVLTKGTFYTLFSQDGKPTFPIYKVSGTFNLQLK